jgi:hypothetical protein
VSDARPEPIIVQNAGLVLLWPFLARYFEASGLVDDGEFSDNSARSRSIHLLQYLACRNHEASDHALALNKTLCGMPLTQAPDLVDPPTEEEKRDGLELLDGVIQHWGALGNMSVQKLQEAFLMREGGLLCKEQEATLTVSLSASDILLQRLPWNFGLIRLPWQQKPLIVKWT